MVDKTKEAMDFFVGRGWQPHQAAGIVGNLLAESGLNSGVFGDHGTAGGLGQWRGERLTGLQRFAAATGNNWKDFNTQLAFVDRELRTTEKSAGDKLMAAKNVSDANAAMITYERPQGSEKGVHYAHNYSGRLKFSRQALGTYSGGAILNDDAPVGTNEAPIAYDIYTKGAPERPDIYSATATKEENEVKPYGNFFEEVGASLNDMYTANAVRYLSEDTHDPLFVPSQEQQQQILKLPDNYQDFLLFSGSENNYQSRLQWVRDDIERQQKLSSGGWSATAAGLTAALVDPVSLAVGASTGGLGVAATGAGIATRMAVGAAYGSASGLALDATSKYILDDPNAQPLMAAGAGAVFGAFGGAIARTGRINDANAILTEGVRESLANQRAPRISSAETNAPKPNITIPAGNLSSARNTEMKDSLIGHTLEHAIEMNDDSVPVAVGRGLRFDVTGQMTTSQNPLVRAVGYAFFEEPVGTKAHDVIPDSVNSRYTAEFRASWADFSKDYQSATVDYLKEFGVSKFNLVEKGRLLQDFSRKVTDYVENPATSAPPSVKKAGEAFRRQMKQVAEKLREVGFDIPDNENYVPLLTNIEKIAKLDHLIPAETVHKFLFQAIKNKSPDIDKTIAEKMAKGWWSKIRKAGFGMNDEVGKALSLGDREAFKAAFKEALEDGTSLSEEELDKVFSILTGQLDATKSSADDSKGIARLKRRTLLDYNYSATIRDRWGNEMPLKMRDFFEDDAEFLMHNYLRNILPRIEFAKTKIFNEQTGEVIINGFRGESDIIKLKNAIIESFRKRDVDPTSSEVKNALQNVDFGWKRINGYPIWNQSTRAAQWARRLKDSQFIRLMSNMGLNQIQESWKIISMTGFRATLQQLPAIKSMVAGVASKQYSKNQLLDELMNLTGLGTEELFNKKSLKMSDERLGQSPVNSFERKVDGALDVGKQLTSQLSLMHPIMDFQQRWAMTAITQQLANIAKKAKVGTDFDLNVLPQMEKARLATLGMGTDDLKKLFSNLLKHSNFSGDRITGINLPAWEPEVVSKFRYFLGRYTDRLVQANDFGSLAKWMSHPIASMFIQFRPFVLGAWAKSTLHALNHGAFTDPKMITMILGELAAGVATFVLRKSDQLVTEEGREKFWEETMQPANLLKNGWARTASASIMPLFLDSLLMATPAGVQFGNARSSGTATDAWLGSPVSDQLKSAQSFVKGVMEDVSNGDEISSQHIRSGVRGFLPWQNWVPFTAALNHLLDQK